MKRVVTEETTERAHKTRSYPGNYAECAHEARSYPGNPAYYAERAHKARSYPGNYAERAHEAPPQTRSRVLLEARFWNAFIAQSPAEPR